jgi:hypothetical protein
MPQTLKINTPLKGVNRAFGREAQPANTCYDALNVLPSDRYGRLRLSQRSGIGQAVDLGSTLPVRLLHVASSVGSPAVTTPDTTTALSDTFTRANGNLGVSNWKTYTNDGFFFTDAPAVLHADALTISSNKVVPNVGTYGGGTRFAGIHQTDLTLGTDYDLSMDITLPVNDQFSQLMLAAQVDKTTDGGTSYVMASFAEGAGGNEVFELDVVVANSETDTSAFVRAPTLARGSTHTITLRRRSVTLQLLLDGVVMRTLTSTTIPTGGPNVAFQLYAGSAGAGNFASLDNFLVTTPETTTTGNATRTTLSLVATSGTNTFVGTPTSMVAATSSSTFPINANAAFVSAATLFGKTYIVDGTSIRMLDLSDNTMKTYTASAGSAPTGCTIAVNYRGRLILSGSDTDPQNFFASKLGDPTNWDYSGTTPDAAYAGNDSKSGLVGAPIHALIPISDDLLVIGLEQSMWKMEGDISAGGSLVCISDFAGISSATAWTKAPDGSIYFVGPRGFFKMDAAASGVTEISELAYPQFFQSINRATNFINVMYDADIYAVRIFVTPAVQSVTATTSMVYDLRAGGFWPQDFAGQLNAGPLSCVWWDGYDSGTRYPVLGGYDGVLYGFNSTNRTDNGGAINAYVVLGPIKPSDVDATLIGVTVNLGELSAADLSTPSRWNSNVTLKAGKSAYSVMEGTPDVIAALNWGSQGRTATFRRRLRGEWFTTKLSNSVSSNYFSFESVDLEFNTTGRNRRQGL